MRLGPSKPPLIILTAPNLHLSSHRSSTIALWTLFHPTTRVPQWLQGVRERMRRPSSRARSSAASKMDVDALSPEPSICSVICSTIQMEISHATDVEHTSRERTCWVRKSFRTCICEDAMIARSGLAKLPVFFFFTCRPVQEWWNGRTVCFSFSASHSKPQHGFTGVTAELSAYYPSLLTVVRHFSGLG
jgi:hypothetical protein